MRATDPKGMTIFVCAFLLLGFSQIASSQLQQQQQQLYNFNWPISLSFHETKTNQMLGEAMLKRLYARIGFTDNIIRAEVDSLFERLKEVIEKKLRRCERRRRRAGSVRIPNLEAMYGHVHNKSSNQYQQQRTPKQANVY